MACVRKKHWLPGGTGPTGARSEGLLDRALAVPWLLNGPPLLEVVVQRSLNILRER